MKKYRLEIILFSVLLLFFFFTRLYQLASLPIFTDEAIYIRWAQIANYDPNWRFISLTDGKQPSFIWLTMIVMRVIEDPLLSGRIVSVFAGLTTVVGMFFLGSELFKNRWIGILSSLLYLIFPMALVYDRMALYDSLVGAFTVWSLYLAVLLVRTLRLDVALLLGMAAGAAVLTKTSGFFSLYLLPFTLLLFDWSKKARYARMLKWVGLAALSVVMTYSYYSILRLSPFYHIINEKNAIFVYPYHEWMMHPFRFVQGNLLGLWDWFTTYTTWSVVILIAASFFVSSKFLREKLLLVAWFAIPFVALAVFGKVLYPRFIFFMILPLLPLAAFTAIHLYTRVKNKTLAFAVVVLFFVIPLFSDYLILTDFVRSPIPKSDKEQYINGWPAGGGIKEIITYLEKESESKKIYVASEGTFGSLPTNAVEIYLGENKNIEKRGIWPTPSVIPRDLAGRAKRMPVYYIFNETQNPPSDWPITLIAKYQKGVGDSYIRLFQVNP